MTCNWWLS